MKFLLTTTEVYRFSAEDEATAFIEKAKQERGYTLTKSTVEYKERKQKGEVIDFWWKVTLIKKFNDEKEPDRDVDVTYDNGSAF